MLASQQNKQKRPIHQPQKQKRRYNGGFTIVELLVVVAIISLLVSIILPSIAYVRESGRQAVCRNTVRQLWLAHQLYVTEYREPYGPENVHTLYPDISHSDPFWICTSDQNRLTEASMDDPDYTSYAAYFFPARYFENNVHQETIREKSMPGHKGVRFIANWNGVQEEINNY